ncbi:alpha/beta hydrolase [bacterium SCSIO 12643]|nr:alpha/beta hydrolase [bacterium SCSIO 12643]
MHTKTNLNLSEIAVKRINRYPGKRTIIFLHDSLGCIKLWRDFPEKLGELTSCNVLIYDRQGYGQSCGFSYAQRDLYYMELEADILSELLDHWNIKEAILFGHSDGGSIALIAAGKYPSKIKGVITEGAHIFVEDVTIKGIEEAQELYKNTDLKTKLDKYHGPKTEDLFWAWAATWTTDEFKHWNIEKFLPNIQCPALIIQGEKDEYGTLKQVEDIVSQSKDATPLIIPEVKHTPHKEVPDLILEKAGVFVQQLNS